jgi:hypothetical protein
MRTGESYVMSQARTKRRALQVRIFCLAAAVLATGIVCPVPQGITGTEEQREEYAATLINRFIFDGFDFALGKRRAEIVEHLGSPQKSTARRVRNIHDPGKTDQIFTLSYPGLRVVIYRVSEDGREMITDVVVTGTQYRLKEGLSVGSPLTLVQKRLGSPTTRKPGYMAYESEDSAPSQVRFYHKEGRITKVAWSFYVD